MMRKKYKLIFEEDDDHDDFNDDNKSPKNKKVEVRSKMKA